MTIYEYFLEATKGLGDYAMFQYRFRDHMRSEFTADVEALSAYFAGELGLKAGDVYTGFIPTSIEAMILFMSLNRLGVAVNFVFPLTTPEGLRKILKETKSKGIALPEQTAPGYVDVVEEAGLPALICTYAAYAAADKWGVKPGAETEALYAGIRHETYVEALKRHRGEHVEGSGDPEGRAVCDYMQGGGTTGESKTIVHTNGNVTALMDAYRRSAPTTAYPGLDTEISCMPFFHVYGFYSGGLLPLMQGVKTCFIPVFDAGRFIETMKVNHVVRFRGVPNMYRKLLEHEEWDGAHLHSLKSVSCGGDDLSPLLKREVEFTFAKNGSKARLNQGYGLTECCGSVAMNRPGKTREGSIGMPWEGVRMEIWGEDRKPLPDGEVGEIAVSGAQVMRGYLTESGEADVGVHVDAEGRRWVLTGDLGRRDADGFFYFAGRKKRLVIISGYNVHPVDIESIARERGDVQEACAVPGFDEHGKKLVRLYLVMNPGVDGGEAAAWTVEECKRRLQKFSVPRDVRFLTELPRTKVGKVDYRALTQLRPEDGVFGSEGVIE